MISSGVVNPGSPPGSALCGTPIWGLEVAGTGVHARGNGTAAGEGFLRQGNPGEVYGVAAVATAPASPPRKPRAPRDANLS